MSANPQLMNVFDSSRVDESQGPLLETERMTLSQHFLRAEEEFRPETTQGETLIQCVSGRVTVETAFGQHELSPGWVLFVEGEEPRSLRGEIESLVLLIRVSGAKPPKDVRPATEEAGKDAVEEASEESFPASDPPSWTPVNSP